MKVSDRQTGNKWLGSQRARPCGAVHLFGLQGRDGLAVDGVDFVAQEDLAALRQGALQLFLLLLLL